MEYTSLATIDPKQDQSVLALYNEATKLLDYANARVIANLEDTKLATNDLSLIAKLKKAMEAKRKDYLQPFQEHVQEVNNAYKTLMAPVEQADMITRQKVMAYQREQARIAAEQEEINRLRMEAAQKEAALNNGEIKEAVNLVEVIATPKKVVTDMGILGTSGSWKVEVDDITKLPAEYLIADTVKLGKVVRAGLHSIPGCKIWHEDSLRVSSK